jgi:hypothetical protein
MFSEPGPGGCQPWSSQGKRLIGASRSTVSRCCWRTISSRRATTDAGVVLGFTFVSLPCMPPFSLANQQRRERKVRLQKIGSLPTSAGSPG